MNLPESYIPIPVVAAQQLAETFEKSVIVILANDAKHDVTHYTTFGVSAQDKLNASNIADAISSILSGDPLQSFEDFRDLPAAEAKQKIDELTAAQYAPGMWECPKCGFVLQKSVICPNGVFASTQPHMEACPNDGRDMQPVTWKKLSEDNMKAGMRWLDKNAELQKLCSAAAHTLRSLIATREGIPTPRLEELAEQLETAVTSPNP